jgi:hypothetical protein
MTAFPIDLKRWRSPKERRPLDAWVVPPHENFDAARLVEPGRLQPRIRTRLGLSPDSVPDPEPMLLMRTLPDRDQELLLLLGATQAQGEPEVAVRALVEAPGQANAGLDSDQQALPCHLRLRHVRPPTELSGLTGYRRRPP